MHKRIQSKIVCILLPLSTMIFIVSINYRTYGNATWASSKALLEQYFEDSPYFEEANASEDCRSCMFNTKNDYIADSTSKDLIISVITETDHNLIVFMRTLRTTHSKCSVVFLMDQKTYKNLEKDTRKYLKKCGCQVINIGKIPDEGQKNLPNFRFYVAYMFLLRNKGEFNRVIIIDALISTFQGDPFNNQINTTHFNVLYEGSTYSKSEHHTKEFERVAGKINQSEMESYYPCTEYIGASEEMMISFFEKYFEKYEWGSNITNDGLIGYVLYRTNFVNLKSERRDKELVYINYKKTFNGDSTDIGFIRSIRDDEFYSSIIIHNYLSNEFKESVEHACITRGINVSRYTTI